MSIVIVGAGCLRPGFARDADSLGPEVSPGRLIPVDVEIQDRDCVWEAQLQLVCIPNCAVSNTGCNQSKPFSLVKKVSVRESAFNRRHPVFKIVHRNISGSNNMVIRYAKVPKKRDEDYPRVGERDAGTPSQLYWRQLIGAK